MIKMIILIIFIIILVLIKIFYNPKIDFDKQFNLYLWYGKKDKRKYFKL